MSSTNKSFVLIRAEEAKGRANPAIPQMIPNGIRLQGWTVSAQRTHISLSTEIEQLAKEMNAALMPEMAYLHNYLQFEHKGTGMVLRFDAKDALKTCRLNSGSVDADQPPDWTFRPIQYAGRMMFLDRDTGKESAVIVRKDPNAKINMELLQRRDPILYYEDVVLYEDELHDIGHCSLSVKTRVMGTCWLVLLRYWLRVDKEKMVIIDTRLFHQYDENYLVLDCQEREDTFLELAKRMFVSEEKNLLESCKLSQP